MVRRSTRKHSISAPLPSDAELDILAALWRLGPSTVREIHDALGKDSGYTTTLKQMQLMTDKGLLVRSERYRSHVYEAGVAKEQTQKQIAADMLKRGFEGSAKNLVLGALAAQPASRQELEEIRQILDELHKRKESR
jgi:BlaI family transcriptional regulator, penicillinase repressor